MQNVPRPPRISNLQTRCVVGALARERRSSHDASVAWLTAFAGKRAPTTAWRPCRNAFVAWHSVRQQAGSYRFCARRRSAVLAGFCVRQTLPVLHRSPVGARLHAKTILMQRIRGLADRVRQQAGSYRFLRTPKVGGVSRILLTRNLAGVSPITCRSAVAREGDLAAMHSWPVSPRSPASRLLQICIRISGLGMFAGRAPGRHGVKHS